ncbi:MAG: hypothetical protein WD824_01810 [Cyclobacteriaceae bacterium]
MTLLISENALHIHCKRNESSTTHVEVGLWVDIGTIGYIKDLKTTKR